MTPRRWRKTRFLALVTLGTASFWLAVILLGKLATVETNVPVPSGVLPLYACRADGGVVRAVKTEDTEMFTLYMATCADGLQDYASQPK